MKLLFDQNLSRKLVTQLADVFPDSSHVQFHGLEVKTDTEIWEFAKTNDFCIVTQDVDLAACTVLRLKLYSYVAEMHQQNKLNLYFVLA
ncbi:DUF5615 family PIN-like protein [Nostoc commune]|uniref:DUF5615 family PIN-like protein n=1 Tax=Nostoc commune TaxID=1178 RepID=UPI002072DD0D|nr:DUF5615 family PIN-like protein [Nostoc commune]